MMRLMSARPHRGHWRLWLVLVLCSLIVAPAAVARFSAARAGSKLRPLRGSPVIKRTAREVVEFEGQNHSPNVEAKWKYSVEAMTRTGHALAGKVLTLFLYLGVVVGKEEPPYHKLRDGMLRDNLQFPVQSVGIQLTVQVVVTTRYGPVKLDWRVKPIQK